LIFFVHFHEPTYLKVGSFIFSLKRFHIVLAIIFLVSILDRIKKNKKRATIILLLGMNSLLWYINWRENRHGILTVAILDIGQGDAIFIEAPNGNQIMIDGGPDAIVLRRLGEVM